MPNSQHSVLRNIAESTIILAAIGAVLVMAILVIRPGVDPILIIGAVAAPMIPTIAALAAVFKAEQTHKIVNSRLDTWVAESSKNARLEGIAEGRKILASKGDKGDRGDKGDKGDRGDKS